MAKDEGGKKVQAAEGAGTGDGARSNEARAEAGGDYDTAYAHAAAGRIAQAEAVCRRILTSDPTHAEALHLLGGIAHRRGENAAAEDLVRKAIQSSPRVADYHNNLGAVLLDQGKADEAIARFRKATALEPSLATAHNNLGNALKKKGDFEAAAASYRRTLELRPDLAKAHSNLGAVYSALGKFTEAEESLRRALAITPRSAGTLTNLGTVLQARGKVEEAVSCYRQALGIRPDSAVALANLGNVLHTQGRLDEAEERLRRAVEVKPDFAQALTDLGSVLHMQGRLDEAEERLRRAVEVKPDLEMAHSNLGNLLRDTGRYDEAEESVNRALEIKPDSAPAKFSLGLLLLLLGDFGRAWEHYAARDTGRDSPRALWQKPLPDDLRGKRLFVLMEQGLGDEIFFLRFAPELKRRGAEITYVASLKIGSIIARLPFIDRVVGEGEEPDEVDITLSAGDLPLAVGMKSAAAIPPPYPLPVEPERAARMATRLKELGPPPYVGITWRAGTPNEPGTIFKLAPLEELAEVLGGVEATFLAVQRKPEAGEIDRLSGGLGRPVHDFTAFNDDLEDMLALLALMDEYVTVSNTNVHLRAGTGRTSRVLVPTPPEYRWMAEGTESPWFPGCRVYRQKLDGSWQAALAALSHDLEEAFGGPGK